MASYRLESQKTRINAPEKALAETSQLYELICQGADDRVVRVNVANRLERLGLASQLIDTCAAINHLALGQDAVILAILRAELIKDLKSGRLNGKTEKYARAITDIDRVFDWLEYKASDIYHQSTAKSENGAVDLGFNPRGYMAHQYMRRLSQ